MDIIWYGQACFKLKGKLASVVIDPYDPEFVGLKPPKDLSADITLATHDHKDHNYFNLISAGTLKIQGPGEYEAKGVTVLGVGVYHDQQKGAERGRNTVYNVGIDGLNVVHLGDIGHTLTEDLVQEIGNTDILLIPVGSVYTIDAELASQIVSQLEPKIIIPMHYYLEGLKFELEGVDKFLKEMGAESVEPVNKFSITKDKLPEEPQVVLLSKS